MSAPAKAYLNKLVFKLNGSTTKDQYVAKFIFGTHQAGGYIDTNGAMQITNSTTLANIKTAIQTWFHLDELLLVSHDGYTYGFIGLIKPDGSEAKYHNLGDYAQGNSRVGNYMKYKPNGQNAVEYIMLNDAGLNTRGWGNFYVSNTLSPNNPDYIFRNGIVKATTVLHVPFYNACRFLLQFSYDGSTWYTCTGANSEYLDGTHLFSARALPNLVVTALPQQLVSEASTQATLNWKLTANTPEEGICATTGTVTVKKAAIKNTVEYFSASAPTGSASRGYTIAAGVASGGGTGRNVFMYKDESDAIIAACRSFTPPVAEGHDYWGRGEAKNISQAGLSSSIRVASNWGNLYWNTSYRSAGYYLLNKNFGFYMNSSGSVTYIFYANVTTSGTPYIQLGIYIQRTRVTADGGDRYDLDVSISAIYINATDTAPEYDTRLTFDLRWAVTETTAAQAGAWFSDGSTVKTEVTLLVERNSASPAFIHYSGYTEDTNTKIAYVLFSNLTAIRTDSGSAATIDGQPIGISRNWTQDLDT